MRNLVKITIISIAIFLMGSTMSRAIDKVPQLVKSGYHINKYFDLVPNDKKDNKKVILITIDDGPTKRAGDMMATLTKHHAKAIFFINGMHSKDAPNTIADEVKAGFTVGNHTWSHINLKQEKSTKVIQKEIDDNTKLITKITGQAPLFFRPPYGASSPYVRDLIKKDGMIFMNWSGAAKDWERSARDEKVFLNNIMGSLHDGEIILIHEHPWTVKYLDNLLTKIEEKGYTFIDPTQITE